MVLLDATTGFRRSELFGLKWSDIDFSNLINQHQTFGVLPTGRERQNLGFPETGAFALRGRRSALGFGRSAQPLPIRMIGYSRALVLKENILTGPTNY